MTINEPLPSLPHMDITTTFCLWLTTNRRISSVKQIKRAAVYDSTMNWKNISRMCLKECPSISIRDLFGPGIIIP